MANSTNRQFHFLASSKNVKSGKLWYPSADVYQVPDGWLVKVELAGVSTDEIEIDIQGNQLYIAGCRRDKSCAVGMTFQQMEITYSRFEKTLMFSAVINSAKIEHNFDNGLLIIRLWKDEQTKSEALPAS